MLRPKIKITFQQIKSDKYPDRNAVFVMPFVTDLEISHSWKNLTDTAKLKFPRKVFFEKNNGDRFTLDGQNIIAGNESFNAPFFLRGDKITIEAIYWYEGLDGSEVTPDYITLFKGYITKINPRMPVEIECEDNMFLLKQFQAKNKLYNASSYDSEDIVKDLINQVNASPRAQELGVTLTFHDQPQGVRTNIGNFRTLNETPAQVLERMRKMYRVNSWFKDDDLHSSMITYFPGEGIESVFIFQQNIIQDSSLTYTRADDLRVGAKCYSVNKIKSSGVNQNGATRSTNKRLEVNVGDQDGELRTLFFYNVPTVEALKKLGEAALPRFKYEGYRGSFTTFGMPLVQHGDKVTLRDKLIPEREGKYFVHSVVTNINSGGWRQTIELDIKSDAFTAEQLANEI